MFIVLSALVSTNNQSSNHSVYKTVKPKTVTDKSAATPVFQLCARPDPDAALGVLDDDCPAPEFVANGAAVVSGDPPPSTVTMVLEPAGSPKKPGEVSEELDLVTEAF